MIIQKKYFISLLIIITIIPQVFAQTSYGNIINGEDYTISRDIVNRTIKTGSIFKDSIIIENKAEIAKRITITSSGTINEILELNSPGVILEPGNNTEIEFNIIGKDEGTYNGEIIISGDINEKIIGEIKISSENRNDNFLIELKTSKKQFNLGQKIEVILKIDRVVPSELDNMTFFYSLQKISLESKENIMLSPQTITDENLIINNEPEIREIDGSFQIKKIFETAPDVVEGEYLLNVVATYGNITSSASTAFVLKTPFFKVKLFGIIPVWLITLIISLILVSSVAINIIKKQIAKGKKYKMEIFTKTLPQKGDNSILLGKVAEKSLPAYLELDRLTTHAVVAGATGGGKSIAAQVLIEEALMKNIAVIVFDPTAQWSGMLRKCDDKKMLSFYPKFGLKESDARAFPGNVRQIQNSRQLIEIEKYVQPGHIQIFTLNKLSPNEMDTFVESIISSIFKSDPKEHPGLKTLLVFDEVHRLLPKFGGSGKGFLQIERACREFRKWGLGVMLVSQVLSDFVGEIKANINTEVQMRTRDESDLNRLKTKYGEEVLQSLIKASVGVGMFINPAYNKGKPYFINFRPILHSTRRLSDEVLDKYNLYGETIEDLEYQIEQLEKEKVDTFDLKMELKLVKDKLMTGNFTVVDIYLEGLRPRLSKQWEKIGKKPKKKELQLISESEVKASLEAAQKERDKWDKKADEKTKPNETESNKETISEKKKEETKDEKKEILKDKEEVKIKEKMKKKVKK